MAKAETNETTTPTAPLGGATPLTAEGIAAAQAEAQAEAARLALEQGNRDGKGNRAARINRPDSAEAEAEEAEDTTTVKMAKVLVFRNDKTSIPDTVFAHEVRILRALHTQDQVKVVGEDTAEVANFDVDNEYARLNRKYRSREGNPVGSVYPGARDLAAEMGVKYTGSGEATRGPARSVQKRGTPAKKKVIGRKR